MHILFVLLEPETKCADIFSVYINVISNNFFTAQWEYKYYICEKNYIGSTSLTSPRKRIQLCTQVTQTLMINLQRSGL